MFVFAIIRMSVDSVRHRLLMHEKSFVSGHQSYCELIDITSFELLKQILYSLQWTILEKLLN